VRKTKDEYYKKDGIVSDVTDRIIISNPNENTVYGDNKDMVMSTADTNSDSTGLQIPQISLSVSTQNIKHFDLKNKTHLK
jgi:hypothetical protein